MYLFRIHGVRKRIFASLNLIQHPVNLLQRTAIETRAGLTDMNELFFLVVQAEHERTKILPGAFGIGEATNHTVNRLCNFDLQPLGSAAFFIAAVALLGENTFKALFLCDFKQCLSLLAGIMIGIANDFAGSKDRLKEALAFFQGYFVQIVSIEIDQIERIIKNRQIALRGRLPPLTTNAGSLLHQAER